MTSEYLNSVYELKRLAAATEALEGDTMLYIRKNFLAVPWDRNRGTILYMIRILPDFLTQKQLFDLDVDNDIDSIDRRGNEMQEAMKIIAWWKRVEQLFIGVRNMVSII